MIGDDAPLAAETNETAAITSADNPTTQALRIESSPYFSTPYIHYPHASSRDEEVDNCYRTLR